MKWNLKKRRGVRHSLVCYCFGDNMSNSDDSGRPVRKKTENLKKIIEIVQEKPQAATEYLDRVLGVKR